MSRKSSTEAVVRGLARHPYLWLFAGIMLLTPLSFGHMVFVKNAAWFSSFAVIAAGAAFLRGLVKKGRITKYYAFVAAVPLSVMYICLMVLYDRSEIKLVWHFAGGAAAALCVYFLADRTKYRTQLNSFLIMGLGFCMKFCYVLGTSMYTRQNDIGKFDGIDGHASYIMYLYTHHSLPNFDPRTRWQYCHPPLQHIIDAVWLWLNQRVFATGTDPARESMQMLSLFCSMCIMITSYRLLRRFKLSGAALYIPLIIINFHPAFVLLSGSVNNDVLSVAFVMGAVLCAMRWAETRSMKDIIKLALCIGLGMMTKIAAALIAPPVALLFLIVFLKNSKKELMKLVKQFVCFGLVCVPLGMWFPVWNYLKWGVPFGYVHEMSITSYQYIDMPFSERVTDFSLYQFSPIYEHWRSVDEFSNHYGDTDHNPLITLLKNSIFGESFREETFSHAPFVYEILPVFFWLNVFIAGAAFVCILVYSFRKCAAKPYQKAFLGSFYLFMMLSFYKTAADYPFTCTMNYRYITPTAVLGALYLGFMLMPKAEKAVIAGDSPETSAGASGLRKAVTGIFAAASAAFAMFTVTVYLILCCKQ